jgi:7,8-dihydropterin-6-yl-methyl-4-(beta-D-ribofuranosyl)aminobenzene 5'-phosphate synthase
MVGEIDLIRNLRITTIVENLVMNECLGQWGLSFFLELEDAKGDRRKLIFDTGFHKTSLLHNIKKLKLKLSDVDCVVISHGHDDHTAATVQIVEAAGGVRVYAHPHTFLQRFREDKTGRRRRHGVPKGEGIEEIERAGGKVLLSAKPVEIIPGVWTTGQIQRVTPFESVPLSSSTERFFLIVDNNEVNDQIMDDQAIWTDVEGVGPFVVTGCAHAGTLNTLLQVQKLGGFKKIHGLVGGTHLIGRSKEYLQQTIRGLDQFGLELISPCHCTGFGATTKLWHTFPNAFVLNFSGRVIDSGKKPRSFVF